MAFVRTGGLNGTRIPTPPWPFSSGPTSSIVIDATGEKVALIGQIITPNLEQKSIRRLHFLLGTVTKAGGSNWTLSLQDLDGTTVGIGRPDGVQDQTVTLSSADSTLVTNAWYTTGALSSDRVVNSGDTFAVVIEFDGSGRLGADALNIRGYGVNYFDGGIMFPFCSLFTASWARIGVVPNILFEFTDGTYGTFFGSWPVISLNSRTYAIDNATNDEIAIKLPIPYTCKTNGFWGYIGTSNQASGSALIYLYDSNNNLVQDASGYYNANFCGAKNSSSIANIPFRKEVTLTPQTYRLSFQAFGPGSNSCSLMTITAGSSGLAMYDFGSECHRSSRVNAGAWTDDINERPIMGLNITAIDYNIPNNGIYSGGSL